MGYALSLPQQHTNSTYNGSISFDSMYFFSSENGWNARTKWYNIRIGENIYFILTIIVVVVVSAHDNISLYFTAFNFIFWCMLELLLRPASQPACQRLGCFVFLFSWKCIYCLVLKFMFSDLLLCIVCKWWYFVCVSFSRSLPFNISLRSMLTMKNFYIALIFYLMFHWAKMQSKSL